MGVEILMPAISPSMVSGKLVRWHVELGAKVRMGDVLAELETDKAALDIEAPADGILEQILVEGGTADVPVQTVIGRLGDGKSVAVPVMPAVAPFVESTEDAPSRRISPLARRLARELGVDATDLRGTGPKGRVLAADIREAAARALTAPKTAAVSAAVTALPAQQPLNTILEPQSAMRRTIARRLVEAKQTVPHFYLEARCKMDALQALRGQLNAAFAQAGSDTKLTVNDLVMKAYASAIAATPDAMVTWSEEGLLRHAHVDIGLAVALKNGLITPILRDAARLSLGSLAQSARTAIARAKSNQLSPEEYSGGLAGISNLGMFGVSAFSAIINPPQSMNLAVGTIETELALNDGQLCEISVMRLTLSVDHRAIDGALAAKLLQNIKRFIEHPVLLAS